MCGGRRTITLTNTYTINWKILNRARSYNPGSDRCNLGLMEEILYYYVNQRLTLPQSVINIVNVAYYSCNDLWECYENWV